MFIILSLLFGVVKLIYYIKRLNKTYNSAKLYINGSFFNENELDFETGSNFICTLRQEFGINEVTVESRTEFVSYDKVNKYIHATNAKFRICFGLETANDEIRNLCINKGESITDFFRAVGEIKPLCEIKVYLLVKPPFLTELEAINDVVDSVGILVKNGIFDISFTPVAVQENTILQFLLAESLYRPVWIWSIIEINSRIKKFTVGNNYKITLSGLDYYPEPISNFFNCEHCTKHLINLLSVNPSATWEDLSGQIKSEVRKK